LQCARATKLLLTVGSLVAAAMLLACTAVAMSLPPGFQARTLPLPKASSPTYANGLQKPSTLDFTPDGKLFVAERNGRVLEFDSLEDQTPTLVLSILDKVMAKGDRGILGMKLDPEYPAKPYVYLSYTYDAPIGGDSADSTHTHYADGADDCEEAVNESIDCLVSGRLARVKVDPVTNVAVGGPDDPSSEEVLVNSWCQQVTSHSIGDIEFDSEGALLMSGGEGASWGSIDYGQHGNPCNDPPYEGGSLRAQDLRTPATPDDPTDYSGSIIRVNRETGAAMSNNPLAIAPLFASGVEDVAARRILAEGLRNPYRFTLQPGTGEVYVGDVGQDLWEEINHFTPPPVATGQGLTNFGWPCYEGGPAGSLRQPRWEAAEKELHQPLCEALYKKPDKVTAPLFAYPHANTPGYDGHLFAGDGCNPTPGSAVAGLAFYDPNGVPAEAAFGPEYDGALFFSDAARGCIWTMEGGPGGAPDPTTVANFAIKGSESFTPVDIVEGPDGALYVPNFYADSIVEIRYFPGNQAPTAQLIADQTYGPAPLNVHFDASGSSDPDLGSGDNLHFAWDLNGDGEFDDGTAATAEREYTEEANVTAKVRVSDDYGHVDVAETKLFPGDKGPPQVTVEAPAESLEWEIGETVNYEATAADPDGETFETGVTPHWEFTLEHCPFACHEHPITSADSASGSFVAPQHEFPSHLKLAFTATDSRGMSDTKAVEIYPRTVEISVESDPAGISLGLEGVESSEPASATMIAGGAVAVSAPQRATIDGQEYEFASWSDGQARSHEVTSSADLALVAHFVPASPEVPEEHEKPLEEQPPSSGGDGGSGSDSPLSTPPVVPPPPARAHLRVVSIPPGVPLRLGAVRSVAPFGAELELNSDAFLAAPAKIRRHGRVLRFRRWLKGGSGFGASRRRQLLIENDAKYTAVYAATARSPVGAR
jgi:glucose/arabinose dehydrogenase